MKTLKHLHETAGLYDGYVIDLWGCVHNGARPYPDAIPALLHMKNRGGKVCLLSNAPRRAWTVAERLTDMGVTPECYDHIVTSGEATHIALRDRYVAEWGPRIFHLGPARDNNLYENLNVTVVQDVMEADFILNTGVYDFSDNETRYTDLLADAAANGIRMVCANPDRVVHIEDQLVFCAGQLAEIYTAMPGAGDVAWLGKPYPEVYNMCFERLGVAPDRILAIGDGMPTDIAGAVAVGIDSALITSGIHREHFGDDAVSDDLWRGYKCKPTYLIDRLVW